MIYAFIVLRGLLLAGRSEDAFPRLAVSGLLLLFGLQATINMMVNVNLIPAKGMTLPFISYGGSSLFSAGACDRLSDRTDPKATARAPASAQLHATCGGGREHDAEAPRDDFRRRHGRTSVPRRGAGRDSCAARGCGIVLVTDNRIGELAERFPADEVVAIPAATPSGRSPLAALRAVVTLARGFFRARRLIARARPDVVVGFGGYPTVPPLLAGSLAGCRTVPHEQNGVIGRANRFLAGRVTHLASSVPEFARHIRRDERRSS